MKIRGYLGIGEWTQKEMLQAIGLPLIVKDKKVGCITAAHVKKSGMLEVRIKITDEKYFNLIKEQPQLRGSLYGADFSMDLKLVGRFGVLKYKCRILRKRFRSWLFWSGCRLAVIKLGLTCKLWKLRGLPICPEHGFHAQSWINGVCKKCGFGPNYWFNRIWRSKK